MKSLGFAKQILQESGKDRVSQLSAAFSYSSVFAIGPLLLVLIAVAGFFYGEDAAQGKLISELSHSVGNNTARTIQNTIANTYNSTNGTWAILIGALGTLLAAGGITSQLQNSFNLILGVVTDPKTGLKATVYTKLKNILLVLMAGIVVAISLIFSTAIIGLGENIHHYTGMPLPILELFNNIVFFFIFIGILYSLFRILPDVAIPKKIAFMTSVIVTIFFIIGKFVVGLVISKNGTASAYGAAASLITLLLWIYYSAQILFIGSEFIKVYGFNNSINYKPKKFYLKRTTIHLDSNDLKGRLIESLLRGYRKGKSKKK